MTRFEYYSSLVFVSVVIAMLLVYAHFSEGTLSGDSGSVPAQTEKAWHRTVPTPDGDIMCITYRDAIDCNWG